MSKAKEAAGRALFDQTQEMLKGMRPFPDGVMFEDLLDIDRAAWTADAMSIVAAHDAEREPCRWTGKDVGDRFLVWAASCRSPVNLAPGFLPGSDGCRYCHGCGKTIEVTP